MVRSRSYDEGEVLAGAMNAFRREGYARVSIPQLEAATGLSSGSLYNSFGDKHGIFLAAFEHYLKAVLGRRMAQFARPEAGLAGLRELFLTLLREPAGETFGCLITNSAIEFGAGNGDRRKSGGAGIRPARTPVRRAADCREIVGPFARRLRCEGRRRPVCSHSIKESWFSFAAAMTCERSRPLSTKSLIISRGNHHDTAIAVATLCTHLDFGA